MTRMTTRLASLMLAVCITLAAQAQTPLPWSFEASRPVSPTWEVYRGESVTLQPTIRHGAQPATYATNATATIYYQTPSMGNTWYSAAATVTTNAISARWHPGLDGGADRYTVFISVVSPDGGANYRATCTLKILPSPGITPNEIDIPPRTLDYSTIDVVNAPWATPADVSAATDGMLTVELDPIWVGVSNVVTQGAAKGATALQSYTEIDPKFNAWDKSTGISITHSQVSDIEDATVAWASGANNANFATTAIQANRATKATTADTATTAGYATTAGTATSYDETDPEFELWLLTDPLQPKLDKTGGTLTGPLALAPDGLTFYGSGIDTNFIVRVEHDGTNLNFNIYEVGR